MSIRIYTAKDGLPSTYVFNTYQDKLGYLWLGTTEGVSRFDGTGFTNYGISDGLAESRAFSGFMDSKFRLWMATASGVSEFKGNKFRNYPLSDSLKIQWVFQIMETSNGRIWASTNVGTYELDGERWKKIELYPGYRDHVCRAIVETKEGFIINYGYFLVFRRKDGKVSIIGPEQQYDFYYNALRTYNGEVYISTLRGLYQIVGDKMVLLPGELGQLSGLYIYFCDSKKRFWIGRHDGSLKIITGDSIRNVLNPARAANWVFQDISEDTEGNIWVGSGKGLIRITEMAFEMFDAPSVQGLNVVYNVMQPPAGPILINNGTLKLYEYNNGKFTEKQLNNFYSKVISNNLIIDNYVWVDNIGWYISRELKLIKQEGNKIYPQNALYENLGKEVTDIGYDNFRKGIMIAVSSQKFPCFFDGNTYKPYMVKNDIHTKGYISHVHQAKNGVVFFATNEGAIYSIDKENNCKFQINENREIGRVGKFYNDPSGDIWILYIGRGLLRYKWEKDSLVLTFQITKAEGLSSDNVTSACFDNHNKLWVSTNTSLTVFEFDKSNSYRVLKYYGIIDLRLENTYGTRLLKDLKGNIWLFNNDRLICFYPEKINFNSAVPSVAIENVELNLKKTDWNKYASGLQGIFQLPQNISLSHRNSTLGIYYKGISSSGTEGIKYSYLLEGLDNTWSSPTSNNYVSFVKLPPGKYSFKVKAQLLNTNWSNPVVFNFTIRKAFWQTWWFYLLTGLLIIYSCYALFRYRLYQKIKILEMRNRISQDLHDEIGASMSGINLLSQMAAEKLESNKPSEAAEYLLKVKNYSQDVIERLSDMVWVFNPQNDSIEKLLLRLKSFAIGVAVSKNIKIHFLTDRAAEKINLSIRQRKAIYLVSKEAINNAFKYSGCSNIYYNLGNNGSKWVLEIMDDGKGFIYDNGNEGNGLRNMKARATEIGADLSIQSTPGKGTVIRLLV